MATVDGVEAALVITRATICGALAVERVTVGHPRTCPACDSPIGPTIDDPPYSFFCPECGAHCQFIGFATSPDGETKEGM